ncbi:TPA: hypothetical protein ACSRV8_003850 [Enterobacter hormaechei subsp. steigerwaltii]|uniref:hypothetical protein n=1 Tax=Enterobacter hormaechei TaxID=158836 RepID=UPI001257D7E2|nr:hypothetical protein [Enterobacter hormaechei]MCU3541949.1 hypothetical protein [Enterobacter hormaechei subsp. steigerwaltii]MBG0529391.1 hypothetical protein [Enterobacter hormaechei]MBK4236915.1 hypothetical protein [Enterobacter hormaechei]MDU6450954.1 hypothetical protein [Enterobacter hormaechei]VAL91316.1 gp83 [Enterobacter hormaechei]
MKLNIVVGKYIITGTKFDLVLSEKKTVTDEKSKNFGSEITSRLGYFSTFDKLVKELCHKEILESEAQSLAELKTHIDNLSSELGDGVNDFLERAQ